MNGTFPCTLIKWNCLFYKGSRITQNRICQWKVACWQKYQAFIQMKQLIWGIESKHFRKTIQYPGWRIGNGFIHPDTALDMFPSTGERIHCLFQGMLLLQSDKILFTMS